VFSLHGNANKSLLATTLTYHYCAALDYDCGSGEAQPPPAYESECDSSRVRHCRHLHFGDGPRAEEVATATAEGCDARRELASGSLHKFVRMEIRCYQI